MINYFLRRTLQAQREAFVRSLNAIIAHPARAALLAGIGVALVGIILTRSLPYVVARAAPDLALWFNPDHPKALEAKANRLRQRLLEHTQVDVAPAQTSVGHGLSGPSSSPARYAAPALIASQVPANEEPAALRVQIDAIARKILANDPLNAAAFRMLAEIERDPARVRILVQEAARRSNRESAALFWLLNDSYSQSDFKTALEQADILLRTRPILAPYVMSYLGQISAQPRARKLLVQRLSKTPKWRNIFFQFLPRNVSRPDTPLALMLALKASGSTLTNKEILPYLNLLISRNRTADAYNAWLQLLSEDELKNVGLIYNPNFEHDVSSLPFDWQLDRPSNATVEFARSEGVDRSRALKIVFGHGRVTFPNVNQLLMLTPGTHEFTAQYRSTVDAKRGMRWRITCQGQRRHLAETEMVKGDHSEWQSVAMVFDIPDIPECEAQTLTLLHDARSASEQLISGTIWMDNLKLQRTTQLSQL